MTMIDNVIEMAKSQVGTTENPKGSNHVKYSDEYGMYGAWCVMFVWWVMRECGLSHLFFGGSKTASSTTLLNYHKSKCQVTNNPNRGDIVIFEWSDKSRHTAIIDKITDKYIYTYDGNVDDKVKYKKRTKEHVIAYIHPDYTDIKYTTLESNSIWSQPIKNDIYRERNVPVGYGVTCYLPDFTANGEKWFKTIKGKYILKKCFDERG